MLECLKKHLYNVIIVFCYTLVADLVYGIWSYTAWQLWYVTLIIVLGITAIGAIVGWLWIKSIDKE